MAGVYLDNAHLMAKLKGSNVGYLAMQVALKGSQDGLNARISKRLPEHVYRAQIDRRNYFRTAKVAYFQSKYPNPVSLIDRSKSVPHEYSWTEEERIRFCKGT